MAMCCGFVERQEVPREPLLRLTLEPREARAHQRLMLGVERDHAIDVLGHAGG